MDFVDLCFNHDKEFNNHSSTTVSIEMKVPFALFSGGGLISSQKRHSKQSVS